MTGLPQIGDTVRITDEAYRRHQPSSPFKTGQVDDIYDGKAEVAWLDPALPRVIELSAVEKVERKKPAPTWADKVKGFALGDTVQFSPEFLRRSGQIASETAQMRGKITAIRPQGDSAIAMIAWSNGQTHKVFTSSLSKVGARGIADS